MQGAKNTVAVICLSFLAGCGDPLAGIPRLSDIDTAETDTVNVAAELALDSQDASDGFFRSLWAKDSREAVPQNAIDAVVADVLSDTPNEVEAPVIEEEASEPRKGLFGRMAGVFKSDAAQEEPTAQVEEETVIVEAADVAEDQNLEHVDVAVAPLEAKEEKSGFWPFGKRAKKAADPQADGPVVRTASVAPWSPLKGLFGGGRTVEKNGPDAVEVSYGAVLPYGQIATVCDVKRAQMGQKVDKVAGYTLFDSKPSAGGQRTHYLTGFDDGCARQFTSALAVFGSVETHQHVRYQASNRDLDYSQTDLAFEQIKSKTCKVSKNTACSDAGTAKLARSMVFVSVYEKFGTSPRWADILLYNGNVIAKDFKSR